MGSFKNIYLGGQTQVHPVYPLSTEFSGGDRSKLLTSMCSFVTSVSEFCLENPIACLAVQLTGVFEGVLRHMRAWGAWRLRQVLKDEHFQRLEPRFLRVDAIIYLTNYYYE